ncbi:ribose ABC transporter permease [Spirochaetia bacterium]|nr:ribose ABC transporter permease [Spirochaetia bacterium]
MKTNENISLTRPVFSQRLQNTKKLLVLIVVAILLYMSTFVLTSSVFSPRALFSLLKIASFLGIVAAGQMFTFLIGGIDMSVGNVITFTGIIGSVLFAYGMPLISVLLITLLLGCLIGAVNGFFISIIRIHPMVMTLAMGSILKGMSLIITRGVTKSGNNQSLMDFANKNIGYGLTGSVLLWVVIGIAVTLILHCLLFGRNMYLLGSNPEVAHLSGVHVVQVKMFVYMICSTLAAVTGIMVLGYTRTTALAAGDRYLLPGVAAVLLGGVSPLGGKGGYGGVAVGVFILIALENLLMVFRMTSADKEILEGVILLIFIIAYNIQFSAKHHRLQKV